MKFCIFMNFFGVKICLFASLLLSLFSKAQQRPPPTNVSLALTKETNTHRSCWFNQCPAAGSRLQISLLLTFCGAYPLEFLLQKLLIHSQCHKVSQYLQVLVEESQRQDCKKINIFKILIKSYFNKNWKDKMEGNLAAAPLAEMEIKWLWRFLGKLVLDDVKMKFGSKSDA